MPFFSRDRPEARPVPSPRELLDEAAIAELDERIFIYRRQGEMSCADALIDKRNAIRPPNPATVPVIPGRPS
jgi:hypothetical protein